MKKDFRPKFSQEQKAHMRILCANGYAIQYIARKFNCRPNSILNNVFDLLPPTMLNGPKKKSALKAAKVSIENVMEIRKLAIDYDYGAILLGRMFNINQTTALGIIKGKTFRWVAGWTRPHVGKLVYLAPIGKMKIKRKTNLKQGPKIGSKQKVKQGVLIKLAKEYNVSTSTVCRWIKKDSIKVKKSEFRAEI